MCDPETNVPHNIMKRMQGEKCYTCGHQGHWSWYCPKNNNNNNNNNRKSLSLSPSPNIVKRMEREKCYTCGQQGHWSWYCPNNNNNSNDNSKSLSLSPSPNIVKRMEREKCYTCGQQGHWSWYCPNNNNNSNDNSKSLSLSPSPNIVKRMEREKCYTCGQQGHWSWYCPNNNNNNNNNDNSKSLSLSPSPKIVKRMEGEKCYTCGQIGHWSWYCPLNSPNTNINRGARCKDFVKWCDDRIDESDSQPPLLKSPRCKCGAGVCRRMKETTESSNGVEYYYACPIKQGHGSCGYRVSEDELLNNTSIDPIQQSRQRSPHEEKDVGFSGSEVADDDLEVTNLVSSCLSTPSRIGRRQSLFQRDVFAADASFGSFSSGWLGRLIFFHPNQSLKIPPPQPFFCCIFPSFDPIVVPKQTSISNGHGECNNPAAINILSTACDIEISKDVVSPNKSLSSERKLMSKVQRQREVILFTQQRLLSDLESLDPHQHESMKEAAKTTFALLNLLGIECEQFSDNTLDFINLASSMAEIDKSMENSPTLEEHNKFIEEEKVRMAHIQDDCIKTEALLEVSNQQRKLLREQVSHLEAMLHEKQNELKSCELETMNIETKLGDLKGSMLEVDITLKDRVTQAEIAREKSVERYTERIAAKTALEKAKLALEN